MLQLHSVISVLRIRTADESAAKTLLRVRETVGILQNWTAFSKRYKVYKVRLAFFPCYSGMTLDMCECYHRPYCPCQKIYQLFLGASYYLSENWCCSQQRVSVPRSSRMTCCQLREQRMLKCLVTFVNTKFMHNSHTIDNDGR